MQSTSHQVQQSQLANKTRLTAVTVYVSPGRKSTRFMMLAHDSRGKAILPVSALDQIIRGVPRGTTFTVG